MTFVGFAPPQQDQWKDDEQQGQIQSHSQKYNIFIVSKVWICEKKNI